MQDQSVADDSKVVFQGPWRFDNTAIQLVAGEYNGYPTFQLRRVWKAPDGKAAWCKKKPDKQGRAWDNMPIKRGELAELGQALIDAAGGAAVCDRDLEQLERQERVAQRPSRGGRRSDYGYAPFERVG